MEAEAGLFERFGRILAEPISRPARAKRIADAIREAGGHRWVGLYDVDIAPRVVRNLAWSGPHPPTYPTFPIGMGLTGRAIAQRRIVNVGDVMRDEDYLTALATTGSEIIVPVFTSEGSEVAGTIDVESEAPDAFLAGTETFLAECARALAPLWTVTSRS
jgi:putative methionine-R-sulfoxide reductase with GAF domain